MTRCEREREIERWREESLEVNGGIESCTYLWRFEFYESRVKAIKKQTAATNL